MFAGRAARPEAGSRGYQANVYIQGVYALSISRPQPACGKCSFLPPLASSTMFASTFARVESAFASLTGRKRERPLQESQDTTGAAAPIPAPISIPEEPLLLVVPTTAVSGPTSP